MLRVIILRKRFMKHTSQKSKWWKHIWYELQKMSKRSWNVLSIVVEKQSAMAELRMWTEPERNFFPGRQHLPVALKQQNRSTSPITKMQGAIFSQVQRHLNLIYQCHVWSSSIALQLQPKCQKKPTHSPPPIPFTSTITKMTVPSCWPPCEPYQGMIIIGSQLFAPPNPRACLTCTQYNHFYPHWTWTGL